MNLKGRRNMKKLKVVQIGIRHEHAAGKMNTLRRMSGIFDIAGVVDEKDFAHNATYLENESMLTLPFEGLPRLTLDEALNLPGLDAVLVEVPNLDLVPVAMKCMEKNIPMHMDKPGSPDLGAYKKLLDGCASKGLPFQMGFMFRGNPAMKKLRELTADGVLGTILELEMNMSHNYGGEIYQHYVATLPGGSMYNLGCHDIDFIVSLLGAPEKVTAFGTKSSATVPDALNNTMAVLEYEKAIVSVRVNVLKGRGGNYRRLSVAGTNGVFELMPVECFNRELTATLDLKEAAGGFESGVNVLSFGVQKDRYADQLEEFARVVRGEIKNPYTYAHDYLTHKVVLGAAGILPYTK